MALTRPLLSQLNTNIIAFSDNLMVINAGNVANRDLGIVFDRSVNSQSNVALFWQESSSSFTFAQTTSSGLNNANIVVGLTANVVLGNIIISGAGSAGIFYANGTTWTGQAGGASGQLQYNLSGALAGASGATFSGSNVSVTGFNVNSSATIGTTLRAAGGLQATPIGNAATSTGQFTTVSTTGNTTVSALSVNASAAVGTTLGVTGNITGGNVNTAGVVRATGDVFGKELWSTQSSGDEGGQLNLGIPATNTSLTSQVTIDVYQNKLRFFQGDNARGAYIDLTQAATSVGTNLLGGGGAPGGANTYVQFNDGGVFGGNANFTYDKGFNTLYAGTFAGTLNGSGQNFKVGDDAWIGDINLGNTIGIKGQQDATQAYIVFGTNDGVTLGRSGSGALTYTAGFTARGGLQNTPIGNATPSTALFTTVGSSGNTTVSALTVNATATIGTTLGVSGNINGTGITLTGSLVARGPGDFDGGLQSTPIGNAAASTGQFTTIGATGTFTGTTVNAATIGNTGAALTGTLQTAAQTNITSVGNIAAAGMTSSARVAPNANASIDLGATGLRWNNVYGVTFSGVSTTAKYADLAEIYTADENYAPGTVVVFGGINEITVTSIAHDTRVAGIISTNPAYLMNSETIGLPVALTGRVPCLVQGPVSKGDVLVTSVTTGAAQKINAARFQPGCVIGKALENILDAELKIIEVVVGRF